MKPLIGISCCSLLWGPFQAPKHAASDTYIRVTDTLVGGVPVLVPANGELADVPTLLARLDGLILTGSRSNVQPVLYGGPPHPEGTPEDPNRDGVTLPLIRAAVAAGLPILAICRGLQELNVALGGSLHQRLQDLSGRLDHSTPINMVGPLALRIGKAHAVDVVAGSWLHRVAGARRIAVNSLHNQGIDRLAPGLVVEATAPDGTIEAVRATAAPGFAVGVQWHPEYDYLTDTISARIFEAFGAAVAARAAGPPQVASAAD
jgi:putative glutamine amidotransferase